MRRSSWPGWIWAIPLAALLLVGWWAFRELTEGGEDITISFDNVHGLKKGSTNLVYRGMEVGKVTEIALAQDGRSVKVTAHVDDSMVKFLTAGTKFWLRGANPSFENLSSLSAVFSGPTIVIEPGPGAPAQHFTGLAHRPVIAGAEQPQLYTVSLDGSVGGLKQGAPVKLRGFTVGEVKDIGFRYDAKTGALATPVTLALYPPLFHIADAAAPDSGAALSAAIAELVRHGLRARLERDPPFIGDPQVSLDMVPGAAPETVAVVDGVPQIPAEPGGGITSIVDRINKVPIEQIAQNVLDTTHHVDQIVSSPELNDAVAQLDATLKQVDETAHNAGPKITTLVTSLHQTAARLDTAAKAANRVLGATPNQTSMQNAMREVTGAARSVRELADFLDRHPEALIQGRSGE